ncbi:unnamed protein product [Rotaria sp. Silwood2]|nr:unnamed protein product [Rotaria sp. Silwood2]CAF4598938.1 unnamed protein product [Rotaria sp. Silwood2]
MAQNTMFIKSNRFVSDDISELQETNRNPIYGYQDLPVMALEQAVERIVPLVSGLADYTARAKQNCNRNSALITWDESAAIYLYSMQTGFFSMLNKALRDENRHVLKPWFAYLKLFITALEKLPSLEIRVWRGVAGNVLSIFIPNSVQTWWSVNSCSTVLDVIQAFVGEKGTVFAIDAIHAKDVSAYSVFPQEQEVILMPGTQLRMKSNSFNFENRFFIVDLKEEPSLR